MFRTMIGYVRPLCEFRLGDRDTVIHQSICRASLKSRKASQVAICEASRGRLIANDDAGQQLFLAASVDCEIQHLQNSDADYAFETKGLDPLATRQRHV